MSKPELFVEPDPELPLALLDQKEVFPHCCYYFIFYFFIKRGVILLFVSYLNIFVPQAGKKLLLITNSDYHYTDKMMQHSFNRFLPNDMGWRDLFNMVGINL